jgi:hypothetical protein
MHIPTDRGFPVLPSVDQGQWNKAPRAEEDQWKKVKYIQRTDVCLLGLKVHKPANPVQAKRESFETSSGTAWERLNTTIKPGAGRAEDGQDGIRQASTW